MKVGCGFTVTAFKPSSPAITPNPDLIIKGLMDSKSDTIMCPPSLIEVFRINCRYHDIIIFLNQAWALNPNHVASLKKLENIVSAEKAIATRLIPMFIFR
jgi:hypothetical protein